MSPDDWKKRLGTVYSTDPNFKFQHGMQEESDTLPVNQQKLLVFADSKQRKGKIVTIVQGFVGKADDLEKLSKFLKTKCGTGGSAKDGEIIIQGDLKQKVSEFLKKEGYNVKLK
jgi:translation initiation factor 1